MPGPEGLAGHEPRDRLAAQREPVHGQPSLGSQRAFPLAVLEPFEVAGGVVVGAVDDPQVLAPTHLEGRLQGAAGLAALDERPRLDDDPLVPGRRGALPFLDHTPDGVGVVRVQPGPACRARDPLRGVRVAA